MQRLLALLACGTVAAVLVVEARQEPAPFRASIDVVDVDVSVLDRNRLPVRGLTADDFTVYENGQSRPIMAFSEVELPPRQRPSAPWMTEVVPDVATNALAVEGRLVAILIDRGIPQALLPAAQRYAEAAVEQLRPGDLGAVAFSTFGVPQNFTADRGRLLSTIRQPFVGLPEGADNSETACYCGVCTLDSMSRIAEGMRNVRQRRKMLFVVSRQIPIQTSGECMAPIKVARERAMRAVEASNVTVYALDPSGLETLGPAGASRSRSRRAFERNLQRRGDLAVFPDHTGGRLVSDPVRPEDRIAEIYRESGAYYVLGFQPGSADRIPRFHDIRVEVDRRDVTLQARKGYYSLDGGPREDTHLPETLSEGLRGAIDGLWPKTGIPLALSASPLAALDLDGGIVAVTLGVRQPTDPGFSVLPSAPDAADGTRVNVLVGAFDRNGLALAYDQQTVAVAPHDTGDQPFEYQLQMRLPLRPGKYEIRAAVEAPSLDRAGSVYDYVDVPDFRREPVTMSGLFLSASPEVTTVPADALSGLVPVVPTARRAFSRADDVTGFFRVYQGISRPATPGYLTVEIRDTEDQVVYRQESRLVNAQVGASRAIDVSFQLPTGRLEPGDYILSAETRHGNETAGRDVRFTIR